MSQNRVKSDLLAMHYQVTEGSSHVFQVALYALALLVFPGHPHSLKGLARVVKFHCQEM